ncbi:peptide-methionine (S)-S-oxide reductase MsrA [Candidatus Bipolaricaulota bacterium]|nr:peptide-methionine (S)-S-oxide reductase MsrA [Candidatus Bipolaricaulota bacterium]
MTDQPGFASYLTIAVILGLSLIVLTGFAGDKDSTNHKQNLPEIDKREYDNIEKATFALGCFWGGDARFGAEPGVIRTRVGYAGGTTKNPNYQNIGDHTESIQVEYNPEEVSFKELAEIFWAYHDPFAGSYSNQYAKILFYHDSTQREIAEEGRQEIAEQGDGTVATRVEKLNNFYVAEDYHQKYRLKQNRTFMESLSEYYREPDELMNSTAAARLNGYIAGYGTPDRVEENIGNLGLSPKARNRLASKFGLDTENNK